MQPPRRHLRPCSDGVGYFESHDISYAPMGRTLMGGMISATILTLLVVPVAYTYFDDLREMWKQLLAIMFGKRKGEGEVEA